MKKILCVALVAVMLLGLIPMTAFAAGETATETYGNDGVHASVLDTDAAKLAEGYYFRIGTNYYKNISDAYNALPAGLDVNVADPSTITITMIANYEGAGKDPGSKAMIFDGNGYTWTLTSTFLFRWDNADITIKNLSLTSSGMRSVQFRPNAGTNQQDIVIQKCDFYTEDINIDIRGTETVGTYTHTLLIDNCDISTNNCNMNNANPLYGNNSSTKANWNVTVNNSKLSSHAANTIASSAAVISINNVSSKKFTLNLTGNTILEAGWSVAHSKGNDCVYFSGGATSYELNIDSTVTFKLNLPDNVVMTSEFVSCPFEKTVVNDEGATYMANANAVKNGVVVPNFGPAAAQGHTLVGYATTQNATSGTALGGTYTGTEAVTFYPCYAENPETEADYIALGYVVKTDVNGDGEYEYHRTVTEAVTTLPAGAHLDGLTDAEKAKHTVTLLCDIGDAGWGPGGGDNYFATKSALIFDGNGNDVVLGKYNATTPHYYTAFEPTGADLVVQNVPRFECGRLARVRCNVDDVDVTVKNSNIVAFDCMGLYLTSTNNSVKGVTGYVTVDGSSITTVNTLDGNNASPIFMHYDNQCGDINWVININDSTLTQSGTNISSYDAAIVSHTGENLEINITGNSALNVAGGTKDSATDKNHYAIYVANSHADNNVSINIASTVAINANIPDTTTTGNVVYIQAPATAAINSDAKYTANAKAMALGVILPVKSAEAGETFVGWTDSEALIKAGAVYTSDAAANFTPVYFTSEDYGMIAGASLRTVKDQNGIRFTSYVSDAFLAELDGYGASVSFGTLVASNALLGENELLLSLATGEDSAVAVNIVSTKLQNDFVNGEVTYDNALHAAVLMPETVEAYELLLAARGYMTITFANGTETFYTGFDADDNVRSMLQVAELLSEKGTDNEVIQAILAACNANA